MSTSRRVSSLARYTVPRYMLGPITQTPQGTRCTEMMPRPCRYPHSREQGLLHGFGGITWAVVLTQSLGGILVAVCIRFADNILRTFAQTVAVLFGAFGSYFLFDFQITTSFNVSLHLLLSLHTTTHPPADNSLLTTYLLLLTTYF